MKSIGKWAAITILTCLQTIGIGTMAQGSPASMTPVQPLEEVTIYLPGNVPLVMVRIPAGSFQMGSPDSERGHEDAEEPVHTVTITQDFYMGKHEVTQAQWEAVMGTAMPTSCGNYGVGATYPVYCVSWEDVAGAGGFVEKLNQYLGSTKFRLPTEAEWEYGARGGWQTPFSFGDDLTCRINMTHNGGCTPCEIFDQSMWWDCNSWDSNIGYSAHPVGEKTANPFGLFDVHGNNWEWVMDWWGAYSSGAQTDPKGPETGTWRVMRGGCFESPPGWCRSAERSLVANYTIGHPTIGFRLAASDFGGGEQSIRGHVYVGSDTNHVPFHTSLTRKVSLFNLDGTCVEEYGVNADGSFQITDFPPDGEYRLGAVVTFNNFAGPQTVTAFPVTATSYYKGGQVLTLGVTTNLQNADIYFGGPIIMVHGFGGGQSSTWQTWRNLLGSGSEVLGYKGFICFAVDYYTDPTPSWSDRADWVKEQIDLDLLSNFGGAEVPKWYLLAHSMGGLTTRAMLDFYQDATTAKLQNVTMLGTPNSGSDIWAGALYLSQSQIVETFNDPEEGYTWLPDLPVRVVAGTSDLPGSVLKGVNDGVVEAESVFAVKHGSSGTCNVLYEYDGTLVNMAHSKLHEDTNLLKNLLLNWWEKLEWSISCPGNYPCPDSGTCETPGCDQIEQGSGWNPSDGSCTMPSMQCVGLRWEAPVFATMAPPQNLIATTSGRALAMEQKEARLSGTSAEDSILLTAPTLIGYEIYRASQDIDALYSRLNGQIIPPTTTVFSDMAPLTGTSYYRAKAIYDQGTSNWSNTAPAIVQGECKLACTATVAPSTGTAPLAVEFSASSTATDCSSQPTYTWAFGEGQGGSSQQTATHTYSASGSYNWILTVTVDGQTCTKAGTITVTQAPACELTCSASALPTSGTSPLTVDFSATASAMNCTESPSYLWNFGDQGVSIQQSASHTYLAAGSYLWTLTVTVDGETCSHSGTITVQAGGHPSITVTKPTGGETFYNGQAIEIRWTSSGVPGTVDIRLDYPGASFWIVEGTPNDGLEWIPIPIVLEERCDWMVAINDTAQTVGDFSEPFCIQNESTCSLSCSASTSPTAGTAPLAVSFAATATATNCFLVPSYLWGFGDDGTSTQQNTTHTYTTEGTYGWTLTVTADNQACTASGTVTVSGGSGSKPGDCDLNGSVSIGEVQKSINMFLGILAPACAVDCNGDEVISIGEVQKVINGFLGLPASC